MVELALVITLVVDLAIRLISYGMIFAVSRRSARPLPKAHGLRCRQQISRQLQVWPRCRRESRPAGLGVSCNSGHLTCTASPPYLCNVKRPNVYCVRMTVAYDWSAGAILPAAPICPQPTMISPFQSSALPPNRDLREACQGTGSSVEPPATSRTRPGGHGPRSGCREYDRAYWIDGPQRRSRKLVAERRTLQAVADMTALDAARPLDGTSAANVWNAVCDAAVPEWPCGTSTPTYLRRVSAQAGDSGSVRRQRDRASVHPAMFCELCLRHHRHPNRRADRSL